MAQFLVENNIYFEQCYNKIQLLEVLKRIVFKKQYCVDKQQH